MAKSARFQYQYRKNASKLHKAIGEALRSGPFKHMKVYQEYPLTKINPLANNKYHIDWVVLDLQVAIEGQGQQHYRPSSFGGITHEEAIENLADLQYRDREKEQAVIDAGWTYLSIPYKDIKHIDWTYLTSKMDKHWTWEPPVCHDSLEILDLKEKQRQYRKQQYQRSKEWRDQYAKNNRHSKDNT